MIWFDWFQIRMKLVKKVKGMNKNERSVKTVMILFQNKAICSLIRQTQRKKNNLPILLNSGIGNCFQL